jgi:hypothetical protein
MKKAIQILTDGTINVLEFDNANSLEVLQKGVGGWVEAVDFPKLNLTMWLNEEGKLTGLEPNPSGTMLWWSTYGQTDHIVGDIVLTGMTDDEGDTQGLTPEQVAQFTE